MLAASSALNNPCLRCVWDMGSRDGPHLSQAWPAPSPIHLHLKLFRDLCLSSLSRIQVCFLGCALLRFENERHVRPLPLDRRSVGIWYINIQTNTCDRSSKTGECRKLLKRNEMPYRSGPWERMVCEYGSLELLFCFVSLPPSLFMVAQKEQTFGVRVEFFVTHRNRLNMASQIWLCSKLARLPLPS